MPLIRSKFFMLAFPIFQPGVSRAALCLPSFAVSLLLLACRRWKTGHASSSANPGSLSTWEFWLTRLQVFRSRCPQNIEEEAVSSGYDLLLPFSSRAKSPEGYIRSLRTRRVAGCIMMVPNPQDPRIQALLQTEILIECAYQAGCAQIHARY